MVDNYLTDRRSLVFWFYNIHKKIILELIDDKYLDQSYSPLTYLETNEKYENFRASCHLNAFHKSNSCRLPANK